MISHGTCGGCGRAWTCAEVLDLFRGFCFSAPMEEGICCPGCLARARIGDVGEQFLLEDFDCKACAGSVSTTRLQELLANYTGTMAGVNIQKPLPGSLLYTYSVEPISGRLNWVTHAWTSLANFVAQARELGAGTVRTPGGGPIRPGEIVLTKYQVRCSCNKCERLRVRYA